MPAAGLPSDSCNERCTAAAQHSRLQRTARILWWQQRRAEQAVVGSSGSVTTIDQEIGPVDHGGSVGREKHCRRGDLLRIGEAPGRNLGLELVTLRALPRCAARTSEDHIRSLRLDGANVIVAPDIGPESATPVAR